MHFGSYFLKAARSPPGQSKINIILLGTEEIFVELMDMDTKCSLKGNFILFFRDCILAALAGNGAYLSHVHFPQ